MASDPMIMRDSKEKKRASAIMVVKNDRGLHTRPSTEIVKLAAKFRSSITLIHKKIEVNARSLLGILMLAAEKGAKIEVIAEGPDAESAVQSMIALSEQGFHMDY